MGLLTLYQPFHPFLEGDLDLVITVIEYGLISSGLFLTSFITCNLLKIKISRYFNRIALYTLLLSLITFILGFRKHLLPRNGEPFCRILSLLSATKYFMLPDFGIWTSVFSWNSLLFAHVQQS